VQPQWKTGAMAVLLSFHEPSAVNVNGPEAEVLS
jgi:hypothetical protein